MSDKKQVVNYGLKYINGLNIAKSSNTSLTVSAGQCRDSSNTFDIVVTAPLTLSATVVGANGIDVGTFAASKCYAVFVIKDSALYNSPALLLSLSATAPVMPSGYDSGLRIGWWMTNSSTYFIDMYQAGAGVERIYTFDAPVSILSAGTQTAFTAIDLSGIVPAVDNLPLCVQAAFTPAVASAEANFRSGGSSATNGYVMTGTVATKVTTEQLTFCSKLVSSVPKIEYKVATSGSLNAAIVSFIDFV
jgi:hypothetical protein